MKICKRFFKFSLIIILLNLPVSLAYSKTVPSSFAFAGELYLTCSGLKNDGDDLSLPP